MEVTKTMKEIDDATAASDELSVPVREKSGSGSGSGSRSSDVRLTMLPDLDLDDLPDFPPGKIL